MVFFFVFGVWSLMFNIFPWILNVVLFFWLQKIVTFTKYVFFVCVVFFSYFGVCLVLFCIFAMRVLCFYFCFLFLFLYHLTELRV